MIRGGDTREVDRYNKQADVSVVRRVSTFLDQRPSSRPRGESAEAASTPGRNLHSLAGQSLNSKCSHGSSLTKGNRSFSLLTID